MTTLVQHTRTCLASLLAISLGGCWSSSELLITQANSVEPVPSGKYEYHADGDELQVGLIKFPGGGYIYWNEDGAMPLFVHDIGDNWFVLQLVNTEDDSGHLFGLGHIEGAKVTIYDPECYEEILTVEGVEGDTGDCNFKSLDALVAASKLAAAKIAAGTDVNVHGWFEMPEKHAD